MVAYLLWGSLPVYWKALQHLPAIQILAHRVFWSFLFLLLLVVLRRHGTALRSGIANPRVRRLCATSAALVTLNWLTYIWAVNAGRIVETSLGYYINPLVSVLLGVLFLRERLRPLQWGAVALAGSGVLYLTLQQGGPPWIALVLAASFGLYGLVKKTVPIEPLAGLACETGLVALPALIYLAFLEGSDQAAFGHAGWATTALLACSGLVTAMPLLLFAAAARQISLTTVGLLQYIAPTCALLLGVWIYHEPFTRTRLVGFSLIWLALAVYWVEGTLKLHALRRRHLADLPRATRAAAPPAPPFSGRP
ncbi:MAG: EamA family transporter RarD [Verrucomicrobia bacterium]|nr:EamA family transporter RarD [Verrucomicrobiota bacterium]